MTRLKELKKEASEKSTALQLLRWREREFRRHGHVLDKDEMKEFQAYCEELHQARLPKKKDACLQIKTPGRYIVRTAAEKEREITVIEISGELFVAMPLSGHKLLKDCKGIKEVVSHAEI